LKKLVIFLEQKGISDFKDVDSAVLQSYMDYLIEYDYAASTITRNFIAIKSLFSYLCDIEYTDMNPAIGIKLPKVEGTPNTILNKEEMEKLLNPPVVFSFKGLRDRAMLLLLYNTKISISELVKLKVSAIDFNKNCLISTNNKQKKVYSMSDDAKEALTTYIEYRRLSSDDWLFPNRYGTPMSRQGFWKTIKNYAKEIGIEKEITLYSIKQGEL
jgi:integrase/recombinase XerD